MLTYIKKNLIIAALEDSLLTGKKAAGISTLAEMDMLLAALRSRLNANPDAVTDKSIWQMYARLNALKFPSVSNIWWAFNDLSMFDSVDTDTIGWSNVTGKPTTFPPTAHAHDYASITGKPTTFAPSAHSHAVTAYVRYLGNGAASRVLTLSASILPTAILLMRDDVGMTHYWQTVLNTHLGNNSSLIANAISVAASTVTLTTVNGNGSGYNFTLLAWGNAT